MSLQEEHEPQIDCKEPMGFKLNMPKLNLQKHLPPTLNSYTSKYIIECALSQHNNIKLTRL